MRNLQDRANSLRFLHDLTWSALAPTAAILVRERGQLEAQEIYGSEIYVLMCVVSALLVFPVLQTHRHIWHHVSMADAARVASAAMLSVIVATFLSFIVTRHDGVARIVPILHFIVLAAGLLGGRLVRRWFYYRRPNANAALDQETGLVPHLEPVLLVGAGDMAQLYMRIAAFTKQQTVEVVGILDEDASKHRHQLNLVPILGSPENSARIIDGLTVQGVFVTRVIVCSSYSGLSARSRLALEALDHDKHVHLQRFDELLATVTANLEQPHVRPKTVTSDRSASDQFTIPISARLYLATKPIIDRSLAAIALVLILPLAAAVACLVGVSLGWPVFFWQQRPGLRGQPFRLYKFRTMRDAFDRQGRRIPDELRQNGVSRFLRRTRMDEIPQLYNIMIGDMALIGPRPLLHVDQPQGVRMRLQLRPGVTGWAQVNGGKLISPVEKLALDLWYARHASLWLDLQIVYRSALTILRGDKRFEDAIERALAEGKNFVFPEAGNVHGPGRNGEFVPG